MTTRDNYFLRYGIWRCDQIKRRGTVILLGGRTEFMEKYAETIGALKHRGFDVYSFDWRGQGLSSRELPNRHKGFVKTYGRYVDDLAMFVENIVKPEAVSPFIILAHSMGGHIALRYLHDYPGVIERAILVSPMIDILTSSFPRWLVRLITRLAAKAGQNHAYVIGSGNYSAEDEIFEGNRLTIDPRRFLDAKRAIAKNPDLALGGVTYGWLAATFASIDILKSPGFGENIAVPILMIGAGADEIVSVKAQKTICSHLQQCRLTVIPRVRHEILKETDAVQSVFWDEFDRFTAVDTAR
ncbi:MAG: alpha/beta hydrolase [Proteobacteria bacterium]|uniref:Alpha/beta hydrolase n=1 Tax=Candidatus Desulfatibia profunda TaxID=2841695 RepID=A0A8J6NS14_9BACT|nr:alpha/beta hydrolase [Candidatus Desulfatibia profunda]MBU0699483.1 alpha/beta hydrolase [Pseudomonadota bacterium]